MRTTDSDGEVLLSYEADTENFLRYRGSKNDKDITVYLDKKLRYFSGRAPSSLKAIIRIDERGEDRPLPAFRQRDIDCQAEFERDRAESKKFRAEQLYFLASINGRLETLIEETKNANTQNNRSNRTKKRSKRSR